MIKSSTTSILARLRRAGAAPATSPNIESILARAAQHKRRRQIGMTAASVVIVAGLGLSSAQLLSGSSETSISAAGVPVAGATPSTAAAVADSPAPDDKAQPAADDPPPAKWTATPTTAPAAKTTTTAVGVNQSIQAAQRVELTDDLGGVITVDHGQLMHRMANGDTMPIELPAMYTTTDRRITDIAMLNEHPFMLVSDFTDRPDLVADDAEANDAIHQELAIYAIDLATNEVHIVEERIITEQHSPEWVYNGHVTTNNNHIMVVRELWQSMCVYVEGLDLSGNPVKTAENPLPEPSLANLTSETISDMQAGIAEPPRGCIPATELPDGAMSVLGVQANSAALEEVNALLRSAASLTASAVSE